MSLRVRKQAFAGLLLCSLAAATHAAASKPSLAVHIEAGAPLRPETPAVVVVLVRGVDEGVPLLITPHVEGSAVELVRGRLLRADAKPLGADTLRFDVPVLPRAAGTAIFRAKVATYACETRCTRATAESSAVLQVVR